MANKPNKCNVTKVEDQKTNHNQKKKRKKNVAIGLEEEQVERYTEEAKREGITRSQLLREMITLADLNGASAPALLIAMNEQINTINSIRNKLTDYEYGKLVKSSVEINKILGGKVR